MDTILIALAFLGVLAGLIIVGMMATMYFYKLGALGFPRFKRANGIRALTARSVPFQVTTRAGQSEVSLGLSSDPGTRYARGSMLVTAIVLLMFVAAVISALSALIH